MLEWLAATTGIELGKLVLEQVLDLSKPVLEGYVQDFFKDCLSSGVSRLNATALKTPIAEAVGYFIKRFIKELQINDVPDTSIQHHYKAVIKKFVQNKAVRPILGKAFEKDCKQINYAQLEQIWAQQHQVAGWQFPSEEFDWRGICKEYVYEVKGIVKANPELRSLLETDLLEDIARNTAQLSPGFDVETYRNSLQSSYGYLKLYALDSTDRVDAIKLWSIFIQQTVREALPPMRYDLPLDLKRQLQAEGQLEADLSPEALEHYRHEYFQRPARKVLEAVADSQWAVILGDPGSGKSSLLQYLALEWVEGNTEKLPLLIELREFAITPAANFLEFLHRGRGVDWQFDQQQLHQHLLEFPTLIMFDGLDEVFDRATQSTVIDDIIRFSQQYPKAQVLVTSRIIGYNPDGLQHGGFRHFTIQSLDTDEIHEFIDRWYDLSMGSDPDKVRLKQRLKDAIANSKAIANLADNPLLLTMMVILNKEREQGLPQNRIDLYNQASELLLHKWDYEAKYDLKDPRWKKYPVEIDHRDKQAILRQVAYFIQESSGGLRRNLISREDLENCLKLYLKTDLEAQNAPSVAKLLVDQLYKRDFVICCYGSDTYGFMHRTFLEYFCAMEIAHRFEKQRTLTFEQLRDEVFGQHWQDKTWHEVLRLICGMISVEFANKLIDFLLNLFESNKKPRSEIDLRNLDEDSCEEECNFSDYFNRTFDFSSSSLLLAFSCSEEIEADHKGKAVCQKVITLVESHLSKLQDFIEGVGSTTWDYSAEQGLYHVFSDMAKFGRNNRQIFDYVEKYVLDAPLQEICSAAIWALVNHWADSSELLELLLKVAVENSFGITTFSLEDPNFVDSPRRTAMLGLLIRYATHPKTIELLRDRATNDPDEQLREWAQEQLKKMESQGGASEWT
ncbi:MAG: NACHT domain-containing protein [Nodosilinea sp.]